MKKLFTILAVFILGLFSLNAQQKLNKDFYYYQGEKIFLKERPDKLFLKFAQNADKKEMRDMIKSKKSVKLTTNNIEKFAIIEANNETNVPLSVLEEFKTNRDIVSAVPLFQYNEVLQGLTDEFVIKLKPTTSYEQLQKLTLKSNCTIVEENMFVKNQYLISVSKKSDFNAMQLSNFFYETGLFEFSEPNFVVLNAFNSNDEYFNNQWGLKNTGQYGGTTGMDIKAEQAWAITQGSYNIRVAVVDAGVDLTHPDLTSNLLPGYDASGNNSGGAPISGDENHGTACAGIIGALKDNGDGISGVAPSCRMIPIHASSGTSLPNNWVANAINWAWQNGADVISNSWGGGSPYTPLTNAIDSAVIRGRNGKGCVVVFASGNDNASSVNYPASNANVIAVGAIDRCGIRSGRIDVIPNSCDPWCTTCQPGSAYGSALDVVAPGTNIYTTDRQGNAGYNTSSGTAGNYYSSFGGTSAACPHVAGIAALILSVRPDLTQAQVRQTIESTCTKINTETYTYSNNASHPNGTWNEYVGHGLVNAYQAVYSVAPRIDGTSSLPTFEEKDYTITNLPAGTTVTWSGSSNIHFESGQVGLSVIIYASSGSSATLTATLSGAINKVLTKNISVYQGTLSVEYHGEYAIVNFSISPHANSFEWNIPDFTTQIGTGSINSGQSITLTPVGGNNSGGCISARAHINYDGYSTTTKWYEACINAWRPVIDIWNSDLNPTLCQDGTTISRINLVSPYPYSYYTTYAWYIDNSFLDLTTQPYIDLYITGCMSGTHNLSVKVLPTEDVICPKSQAISFSANCSYNCGLYSYYSAAYPNPASNELIIDKIENNETLTTNTTKSVKEKSSEITVLLYSHATTKLAYSKAYSSSAKQIKIDTSTLPNGIYYLNIVENGETTKQQTIVVNH
ncbi:MAG: S8 family serine peptidase [Prevotellaceae bacterium]|jgi:subtilisin family serine protease|nr:S8 family serine peptidase [Prevotellaceae bacterium]